MATLKPLSHQALLGPGRLKPFWDKAYSLHLTRLGKYEKMRMSKGTTQEKKQINKNKSASPLDKITKIGYNKGIANAH